MSQARGERGHRRQRQRAALALVAITSSVSRSSPCSQRATWRRSEAPGVSAPRRGACGETVARQNSSSAWIWRDTALCVSEQLLRGTGVAFMPGGHFKAGQGLGRWNVAAHDDERNLSSSDFFCFQQNQVFHIFMKRISG